MRGCRETLGLSQIAFATQLGVALETSRTWDSGRRPVRLDVLTRANELALRHDPHALRPLEVLARLIRVHVRTLDPAAKDGRLRVTYDTRTTFQRLRARATLADAEHFCDASFDRAVWPTVRPAPLRWSAIPADFDVTIRAVRQRLVSRKNRLRRGWEQPAKPSCISGNLGSAAHRRSSGNASSM
jgi:hypothetical protein